MEREKVDLTGAPATMLFTLYARALHNRSPNPVLRDPYAEQAVRRVDHDFDQTGMRGAVPLAMALRGDLFDRMVADRIAQHPEVTVLHLGCGLDSRGLRLDLPPSVEWYDIDLPEVIELRRKIYDEPEGHHTIAASVTDPTLFDQIPRDRRVLVIAEGLSMYLSAQEGTGLLRRIEQHFPAGDVIMDMQNRWTARVGNVINSPVRAAKATLRWGLGSGAELVNQIPGLALDEGLTPFDMPGLGHLPKLYRALWDVMWYIPALRRVVFVLRMHFDS